MVPAVSVEAYDAARHRVASIDRSSRGRIVVSGPDRASYLQGLLTNDIAALKPGLGCYAAYLTAQGRMIADMNVYELGDVILLTMEGDTKDTVLSKLDQLIFSEDVQLGDVTATFAQTAVIGPDAAATVSALLTGTTAGTLAALPEHGNLRALWDGEPAIVARITMRAKPGMTCSSIARRRHRSCRPSARRERCRSTFPRPKRFGSKPAYRGSIATWTRRRFR